MIDREQILDLFRFKHEFSRMSIFDLETVMLKSEFFVLHLLIEHNESKDLAVSQIAEMLHLSNPAISRTIKGLGEKDWIDREHDSNDRRTTYITVSKLGLKNYNKVFDQIVENTQLVLDDFDNDEMKVFLETGKKIKQTMYSNKEKKITNKEE